MICTLSCVCVCVDHFTLLYLFLVIAKPDSFICFQSAEKHFLRISFGHLCRRSRFLIPSQAFRQSCILRPLSAQRVWFPEPSQILVISQALLPVISPQPPQDTEVSTFSCLLSQQPPDCWVLISYIFARLSLLWPFVVAITAWHSLIVLRNRGCGCEPVRWDYQGAVRAWDEVSWKPAGSQGTLDH